MTDQPGPPLDPERRSRLLALKLAALARDHLGIEGGEPASFPGGAAVAVDARAAVLAGDAPGRSLGRALAWALRHDAPELHLLVDDDAGQLARRAAELATPPTVWWVEGRDLHRVEPDPLVPAAAPEVDPSLVDQLRAAGADVVTEFGAITGEVRGLEIARVVGEGPDARVEVGVGPNDREAFGLIHGHRPTDAALLDVIGTVRGHRATAAADHPLRRLAQERWLREVVVAQPTLAGCRELERHEGPVPRPNLKDPFPAVAVGTDADGTPVVVVCSVGVDLDLVPFAADARLAAAPDARLVLVVPERDALPIQHELAAALRTPATLRTVPGAWRDT